MEGDDILLHLLLSQFISTLTIDQKRISSLILKRISANLENSETNEAEVLLKMLINQT